MAMIWFMGKVLLVVDAVTCLFSSDLSKPLEISRYVSLRVGCSGSRVCPLPAFDIIFLIKKRTKSDVKCVIIDRVDSAGSFCSDSSPQLDKVLQEDGITLETSSPWRQQHLANQIVDGTVGRGVISAAQSLPRSGDTLMASLVSLCMSWHPLYERKPS